MSIEAIDGSNLMPRILIVDDEKNVLKSLSIGLSRHDFSVKQAQSGPDALKLMENNRFDVLVSDVRMFPMDGYTLATRVRHKYPDMSIVLMSAHGFREEKEGRIEGLDCPFLSKPFSVKQLLSVLKGEKKRKSIAESQKSMIEKPRVLIICETIQAEALQRIFDPSCYKVECFATDVTTKRSLGSSHNQLVIIDEASLGGSHWKILNEIDQAQDGVPVFLLVEKHNQRESRAIPDLAVTVIDKKRFLEDSDWATKTIQSTISDHEVKKTAIPITMVD